MKLWKVVAGSVYFVAILTISFLSFAQYPAAPGARAAGPGDFKIRNITRQFKSAPDYGAMVTSSGTSSAMTSKKWLQVEVEFDTVPDWADDVMLRYYVLMGRGSEAKLFVGEMMHVNVQKGTRHLSAMFMHPNMVERYGQGQIQAVAVQLFHQGRLLDQLSDPPTRDRWWEQFTPTTGYLLPPQQSPAVLTAYTKYEAQKATP